MIMVSVTTKGTTTHKTSTNAFFSLIKMANV